jgi:hypothetical protein
VYVRAYLIDIRRHDALDVCVDRDGTPSLPIAVRVTSRAAPARPRCAAAAGRAEARDTVPAVCSSAAIQRHEHEREKQRCE